MNHFVKGISFALAACLIWGLIFIIPKFLEEFSFLEIATGRYFFYGLLSLLFFTRIKTKYPLSVWVKASCFGFATSFGYYTFLVLGLRYATPAICTLILGLSPIVISFYGNYRQKESRFTSLLFPASLILFGLLAINGPAILSAQTPSHHFWGLGCSFIALLAWSWYVVVNAEFLKQHPEMPASDWSNLMGVATLMWVAIFGILLLLDGQLNLSQYSPSALMRFTIGCALLGLLCSWMGSFLWNKASFYLPVTLAGQMTIFETIFGLLFVYSLEKRLPPSLELIGVLLFLIAIGYSIWPRKTIYKEPHLS